MTVTSNEHTLSVQYLAPEDISTAGSLIYQAYHDDPLLQNLLGYDQHNMAAYEKKLRSVIREELSAFWQEKLPLIGLYRDDKSVSYTHLTLPTKRIV